MIKLDGAQLNHPQAMGTILKIKKLSIRDGKLAVNLKNIFQKWEELRVAFGKDYTEQVIKKYAILDDNGNPKLDPKNPKNFAVKEGFTSKEVDDAFKEYTNKVSVISYPRIRADAFDGHGLSIEDYEVLEPIFAPEVSK